MRQWKKVEIQAIDVIHANQNLVESTHPLLEKEKIIGGSNSNNVVSRVPCCIQNFSIEVETFDVDFIFLFLTTSADLWISD